MARRRQWGGWALAGVVACAPGVASRPVSEPKVLAPWPSSLRPVAPHDCDTETCWEARAEAATQRGELDVAAGQRALAFAHAPSPARLDAWVHALLVCAAVGRAREALELARRDFARDDAAWAASITRRLAGLPKVVKHPKFLPAPPTSTLRAAYLALAEDRLPAAVEAFTAAGELDPYHASHLAGALWALGNEVRARRVWAGVRGTYDERGATLHVEPVGQVPLEQVLWSGEQVARVERLVSQRWIVKPMELLRLWGPNKQRVLRFGSEAQQTRIVGAETLLRSVRGELIQYDLLSGIALRTVARTQARWRTIDDFVAVGEGDALREDKLVTLWDARGQQLAQYGLDPWESPFLLPELALGPGGRFVAVAGDQRNVRVIDSLDGSEQTWAFPPPADGEALHHVVALAFTPVGDALVAVDRVGDITTWEVPGGRLRGEVPGRCSRVELATARKHWHPDNDPIDRFECGWVADAAIADDGETVITRSHQGVLQIRKGGVRETIAALTPADQSIGPLALSRSGKLAVALRGDEPHHWRQGQRGLARVSEEPEPYLELLARIRGSQVLVERTAYLAGARTFEVLRWDVSTGEQVAPKLAPDEHLLGVIDSRRVWVRGADVVVLRDLSRGVELLRVLGEDDAFRVGAAPPGRGLLAVAVAGGWDHHVVGPEGVTAKVIRLDRRANWLSPDGRWLAVVDEKLPLGLWDVATGVQVHAFATAALQVEFAARGEAVAWSVPRPPEIAGGWGEVRWRRLDSPDAPEWSLEIDQLPVDIAISGDGDEVLVTTWSSLIRWTPATGQWTQIFDKELWEERVQITGHGATLTLGGKKRTRIFSNDAHLRLLATVAPLPSGGWVAISEAGAVDGSPDAPEHVVTRVAQGGESLIFDGRLGWDGARVPGLVARALVGEDVAPPGLIRRVPRKDSPHKVLRSDTGEKSSVVRGVTRREIKPVEPATSKP